MSRTIPASWSDQCIEPEIFLDIEWTSGTETYGFTYTTRKATILQISEINSYLRVEGTVAGQTVSVVMDDLTGDLRTAYINEDIENTLVTVRLDVDGDDIDFLYGRIASPIAYSDGDRTLSFTIQTEYKSAPVLVSVPENTYPNTDVKYAPHLFGRPNRVPIQRLTKNPKSALAENVNLFTDSSFDIEDSGVFPSGTLTLKLDRNTVIEGTVSGKTVTITDANPVIASSVPCLARSGDTDRYVLFCATTLQGRWIEIEGHHNYCYIQTGNACRFLSPLPDLYEVGDTIDYVTYQSTSAGQTPRKIIEKGSTITQVNGTEKYLVAMHTLYQPTDSLWGYLKPKGSTDRVLSQIPTSYWTETTEVINGTTCTIIEFSTPLETITCEEWDADTIYISSQNLYSNPVQAIKYLFDNFTTFNTDTSSFTSAQTGGSRSLIAFAVTDQIDAIELVSKIADQTGYGLFVRGDTIYIKDLWIMQTPSKTFNDATIEHKSIEMSVVPSEELSTIVNGQYKTQGHLEKPSVYTLEANVSAYGAREFDWDVFVFNDSDYVKQAVEHKLGRIGYSWRTLTFTSFINNLDVELFDVVQINISEVHATTLYGEVQGIRYNPTDYTVSFDIKLATPSGGAEDTATFWAPGSRTSYGLAADTGLTDNPSNCIDITLTVSGEVTGGCSDVEWGEPVIYPDLFPGNGFDPLKVVINASSTGPSIDTITWSCAIYNVDGQPAFTRDTTRKLKASTELDSDDINAYDPLIPTATEYTECWFYLAPDSIVGTVYKIVATINLSNGSVCHRQILVQVKQRKLKAFSIFTFGQNQDRVLITGGIYEGPRARTKILSKMSNGALSSGRYLAWAEVDDWIQPSAGRISIVQFTTSSTEHFLNKPGMHKIGTFVIP